MHTRRGAFFGGSERLWRSLIGLLLAHAIAIQGLAVGFSGSTVAQGLAAFALCLNGAHGTPSAPTDEQAPGSHCLLCTAGWQPLLDAPLPWTLRLVNLE